MSMKNAIECANEEIERLRIQNNLLTQAGKQLGNENVILRVQLSIADHLADLCRQMTESHVAMPIEDTGYWPKFRDAIAAYRNARSEPGGEA